MTDDQIMLVLRIMFGQAWFAPAQARILLKDLKRLVAAGKLNSSKPPYAGPASFQVKP